MVKDRVPCDSILHEKRKENYYTDLFNIFFPEDSMPAGMDRDATKATFMEGGYYKYSIPNSNLTVLALNSMYFKPENTQCLSDGDAMLDWLEKEINSNDTGDYLLAMHVYPGLNLANGAVQTLWQAKPTQRFAEILTEQASKVSLVAGANVHQMRIAAPVVNQTLGGPLMPLFASPAVSPVAGNNPSMTNLVLDKSSNSVVDTNVWSY